MGNISKNFNREEFKCQCGECNLDTVDAKLVEVLQDVRDHFGSSVTITSGNRCESHNAKVGGAPASQHIKSRAADFKVSGVSVQDVYDYLYDKYPKELGLGLYSSWVHVDSRSNGPARW